MPIRPENKARYPANWKTEIRPRILKRAENAAGWPCCEGCGVANYAQGWWQDDGSFYDNAGVIEPPNGERIIKIILTIAHLSDEIEDCSDENLKAWCQRCHNRYDMPARAAGIKARRHATRASGDLFKCEEAS
jgi:hypothetical protein